MQAGKQAGKQPSNHPTKEDNRWGVIGVTWAQSRYFVISHNTSSFFFLCWIIFYSPLKVLEFEVTETAPQDGAILTAGDM